jgi:peroxiredoxin
MFSGILSWCGSGVMHTRKEDPMTRLMIGMLMLLTAAVPAAGATPLVGETAPPFLLPDLFGRTISLDYLDGHPGVVVFCSIGDDGAAGLLVEVQQYQERWGRESLAIVAVNADGPQPAQSTRDSIRAAADRLQLTFPVLPDAGRTTLTAYGVRELPAAVVIDAGGRVAAVLQGIGLAQRQELKQQLILALGDQPAVACTIPRARSCSHVDERDSSASDPAIMAVRLCVCHGDVAAAQVMLSAVDPAALGGVEMRFALAHLLLVQGRNAEARLAFETLRAEHPQASWGEWGLGIVALAEGTAEAALGHIRAAGSGGWSIPEAETAVLKYLEGYWRVNRAAPQEEQFLALFDDLDSVRVCYRKLYQRG